MYKRLNMVGFLFILVVIFIVAGSYIYNTYNYSGQDKHTYSGNKTNQYTILIKVDMKRLELVDNTDGTIVKSYPIATGKPSSPTPLGTFKIIEKAKWGEGFGTRWMGLDVPWGKYGIHGTNKPGSIGSNLSAGCIRMRNSDVEELYDIVKHNTRVNISNGLYGAMGSGFRTLRPGDRGADVLEVQKRLLQRGYYNGSLDGIYGEGMKASLINYLKDNDIKLTDKIDSYIYNSLGIILME